MRQRPPAWRLGYPRSTLFGRQETRVSRPRINAPAITSGPRAITWSPHARPILCVAHYVGTTGMPSPKWFGQPSAPSVRRLRHAAALLRVGAGDAYVRRATIGGGQRRALRRDLARRLPSYL